MKICRGYLLGCADLSVGAFFKRPRANTVRPYRVLVKCFVISPLTVHALVNDLLFFDRKEGARTVFFVLPLLFSGEAAGARRFRFFALRAKNADAKSARKLDGGMALPFPHWWRRGGSPACGRSSGAGKQPTGLFSNARPSSPLPLSIRKTKRAIRWMTLFVLVEKRGLEPMTSRM